MSKLTFSERFVSLEHRPIKFTDRPYLRAVYASKKRNIVLKCSRQTEKSTFLVNTILFEACINPGIQILFVCPRIEQGRAFSRTRLLASIEQSRLVRRVLQHRRGRRPQITTIEFANGSVVFVRAAYHSGDSCRGLSAQLLLVDEFQDIAEGDLPVLQETLSHARNGRTFLTGTPKSVDNHLEAMFRQSTAHEWIINCPQCHKSVILDERCLGPVGIICPDCIACLNPRLGQWRERNPTALWGDGFWICHPMVPWMTFDEILERLRSYDIGKFKNEVLGLSTTAGDLVVTRLELENCCSDSPMATSWEEVPPEGQDRLIAGIDWGGGGPSRTVLVIGFMRSDYTFQVCRLERFAATEHPIRYLDVLAERCSQFRIRFIAADGGGHGHVLNRLFISRLQMPHSMDAILYGAADHAPYQDGVLCKWPVDRSATIGVLFSRVKTKKIIFPRVEECGSFLDEFACVFTEYDSNSRRVKYVHPETQQDDAMHATNYALLLGIRRHSAEPQQIDDDH